MVGSDIHIQIESHRDTHVFDIPNDVGINLMELLKAEGFDSIDGTCGGMALCATCHIKVKNVLPALNGPTDEEINMLETLPMMFPKSRLACQIKLDNNMSSLTIEII